MVPANVDPVQIGRGYGIVESLFEVAEASLSVLLGLCRAQGGFSAALLLLSGSFGLATLVGLPLLYVARETRLYGSGLPLPAFMSGRALRGVIDRGRDMLDRGRDAVLSLLGKVRVRVS